MKPWLERPIEEANLLNPAFCCVVLSSSIVGFGSIDAAGMPYPLAFMVLPIVLHRATRERLPRDTRTTLAAWLQEHAEAKVQFGDRLVALKPHTQEAILFGCLHDWLVLLQGGRLQTAVDESGADRFVRRIADEARECVMRAQFVGKWFASCGAAQTVMALWGIKP